MTYFSYFNHFMKLVIQALILFSILASSLTNMTKICEHYNDNQAVLAAFGYEIPIRNEINDNSDLTYAKKNNANEIVFLQIVNQASIPPIISCLYYLNTLNIIRTKSFSIAHFPRATRHLSISHVDLPSNLNGINGLFYLERLEIQYTNLTSLPYMSSLLRLTFLKLDNNNLTSLLLPIQRLTKLKQLDVSKNPNLKSLSSLNGHQKLEQILASFCSIKQLPKQLPQLRLLNLKNNSLTSLDNIETLGQNVQTSISFIFANNQIKDIPEQITKVKRLTVLNLNGNNIENIRLKYLCQLTNLTKLYIKLNPQGETEQPYTNQQLRNCLKKTEIV